MTDVKLLAHRGSNPYPDHSMAAYEAAINWGADFIEPDLYLTKDGILVSSHDDHAFASKTYAEALAENPALLRFDQVIDLVNQRSAETGREIGITLETKSTDYATSEAVVRMLVDKGFTDPSRVYINSFAAGNLQSLHDTIMPQYGIDIPLLFLTSGSYNLAQIATYADGIAPSTGILTKSLVDQAHALGLEVHTWTHAGTAAALESLVATGVDAIYCDVTDASRTTIDQLNGLKTLYGSGTAETISGTALNDKVYAMQGDDVVRGGAGDDVVYGDAGNDILVGGLGSDQLIGGGGTDYLSGDEGSDVLDGGVGNDVIVASGDAVLFRAGAGIDLVSLDATSTIRFEDIASGGATILRDGANLIIRSGDDALVIRNGGAAAGWPASVTFSDGVTWTGAELAAHATAGTDAAVTAALPELEAVLAAGAPELPPVPVNLIVNGGFEDLTGASDAATWGYRNTNPAGVLAGWVNTGDTRAEVHRDTVGGVSSSEGTYWFDLEGAPKNAKLVQTVAGIEQGETYQLKFSIADTDTAQASDTVKVYWGNQLIYTGVPKSSWQEITIDVVGGGGDGLNKLVFESTTASANGAGVALDDVSMIKIDANPNLIVNGSFEDLTGANDLVATWGYRNTSPNGVIPGWKQTDMTAGGRAEVHFDTLNGVSALDGRMWFDMDGNKNNARLVQAVAGVEAGGTYELKFSIADIDAATNDDGIRVRWGGQVIFEGIATAGWETHVFRVVGGAGDGRNELIFEGTETNKNGYGAALDAVSLRQVAGPTEGDDVLTGTPSADVLNGLGGDDSLTGLAGNDVMDGGAGDDVLAGNEGDDTVAGGTGDDRLDGGAGADSLIGGAGDDILQGRAGNDVLDGGEGADTLDGGADSDRLIAGAGDIVHGGAGDDVIEITTNAGSPASVDGGDDVDTLVLTGAGAGELAAASGVERLEVESGSWSVADQAQGFSDILIRGGGTVTSGIANADGDTLKMEQGGRLSGAFSFTNSADSSIDVLALDNAGTIDAGSTTAVALQLSSLDTEVTLWNREGGIIQTAASGQRAGAISIGAIPATTPTADVVVNNDGLIAGRSVAIYASNFGGDSLVINNSATGVLRGGQGGATLTGWIDVVNNAGRIEGGTDGWSYDRNPNAVLNNLAGGSIEALRHAVTGKGAAEINNAAGASMVGLNGSAVNVDNDGSEAQRVTVVNRGIMEGRSAELTDSDGDAVDVDGLLTLTNYGRIAGLGAEGYHDGEPNVSEGIAIGGGTIVNNSGAEVYGYGRGIQVDNSSNANALGATLIVNDGLIQGDGHGPEGVSPEDAARFDLRGNEAINLVGTYDDEVINGSAGRILGGVSMGGGNDRLSNSGLIQAVGGSAIDMGAGDDVVNLYIGANVAGEILLGDGNDRLTANSYLNFDIHLDAGAGNDDITTSFGNDVIHGGAGNDSIFAEIGNDTIFGDEGDDTVLADLGDDTIDGGSGYDTLMLVRAAGAVTVDLTAGRASGEGIGTDSFANIEFLMLGGGDDTVTGGSGTALDLGAGDDTFHAYAGSVATGSIDGGAGDDIVILDGTGAGVLGGLANVEMVRVVSGAWTLSDEDQATTISFTDGAQSLAIDTSLLADSAFAGTITGFGQEDRIQLVGIGGTAAALGAGNILTVTGGSHPVTLQLDPADDFTGMTFTLDTDGNGGTYLSYGPLNPGNDSHEGGNGSDVYDGGGGNDTIFGRAGDDTLSGNVGDDMIDGGSGIDTVSGGAGIDVLNGGSGTDTIDGGAGDDVIDGGSDADILTGGVGNDTVKGGSGADVITGGTGNDILSGGSGSDSFIFATGFGHDTITDFGGGDVIEFGAGAFADFAAVMGSAEQVGGDVVFTADADHSLTLSHVALSSLTADDFRFAA